MPAKGILGFVGPKLAQLTRKNTEKVKIKKTDKLIILDEATSYIDSETEVQLQKALANLLVGRTAIIVAHRLSTARSADTILVLNRGGIVESGNHFQLMNQKGFYFHLNRLQQGTEII